MGTCVHLCVVKMVTDLLEQVHCRTVGSLLKMRFLASSLKKLNLRNCTCLSSQVQSRVEELKTFNIGSQLRSGAYLTAEG